MHALLLLPPVIVPYALGYPEISFGGMVTMAYLGVVLMVIKK